MIEYIESDDGTLHLVYRPNDSVSGRKDIIDPKEILQISLIQSEKNTVFDPHIHIEKLLDHSSQITQESWVVVKGLVRVDYYNMSGVYIDSKEIKDGECSITLRGGHSYKILSDNTLIYEFKTGPYYGVEKDKVYI